MLSALSALSALFAVPLLVLPRARHGRLFRSPLALYRAHASSASVRKAAAFLGIPGLAGKLPPAAAAAAGLGPAIRAACRGATLRLGNVARGDADGGWNVCAGAHWPPRPCVVFSFGSNYDFSFDQAAAALGCEVHVFDPSMPGFAGSPDAQRLSPMRRGDGEAGNITFHDSGLGAAAAAPSCPPDLSRGDRCAWRLETVASAMRRLGHARIELLKIDVEGAEWDALDAMTRGPCPFLATPAVRQLLIEVHLEKVSPARGKRILRRLHHHNGATGLRLWNRDENKAVGRVIEWGDGLHVAEYQELSFVRADHDDR